MYWQKDMDSKLSPPRIPSDIQRQIDACCQRFEQAWQCGAAPRMEDFLHTLPQAGRDQLLRDLAILELHYRSDPHGQPLSD
jgi:hypothetical protein